jgi:4-amino-4-deoxy-L-arabinose transferase-like glycosyltransferase
MNITASPKITWLAALLVLITAALLAQFITVPQASFVHTSYTTNAGPLTADTLVGQTIYSTKDHLAGVAVQFATYSGKGSTVPVTFTLYTWPALQPIRTASVPGMKPGDNQLYRFGFAPVAGSMNQTYFFSVTAPQAILGNALSVDLDARNPYTSGTAFLVRQVSGQATAQQINQGGKPTLDLAFALYNQVPLRVAVSDSVRTALHTFIATWPVRQAEYVAVIGLLVPALLISGLIFVPIRKRSIRFGLVLFLMAAGFALRMWYAHKLPMTSDEGSYLYDAFTLAHGKLSGGDGYVKAPLVVGWLALWQYVLGTSVTAARVGSAVAAALTTIPLYFIGYELRGRRTALLTAGLWALAGGAVVGGVYAHTQPLAILMVSIGIALLLRGLRHQDHEWLLYLSGAFMGAGVMARKSALAIGVVPLLFVLLEKRGWPSLSRSYIKIGIGFAVMMALFFGGAYRVYGKLGVWEAIGINSAKDGLSCTDPSEADQVHDYSIRGMTPFFRENMPLIMLSVAGIGLVAEAGLRRRIKNYAVPKLVWILPLALYWYAWSFFGDYEAEVHMVLGMRTWWLLGFIALLVLALWPTKKMLDALVKKGQLARQDKTPLILMPFHLRYPRPGTRSWSAWLLPAVWFGGLVLFFSNWIKFHPNYISEFIPSLVVAAGLGLSLSSRRFSRWGWPVTALLYILVAWGLFTTNYVTYTFPHTGTFEIGATQQAAEWVKNNIPADQPVFTGTTLVAYLAGHHTSLDISHATWYGYQCIYQNTERLNTFTASVPAMKQSFKDAQWVIEDEKTVFSFWNEYDDIHNDFKANFQRAVGFSNGSNTITIYQRVRPSF